MNEVLVFSTLIILLIILFGNGSRERYKTETVETVKATKKIKDKKAEYASVTLDKSTVVKIKNMNACTQVVLQQKVKLGDKGQYKYINVPIRDKMLLKRNEIYEIKTDQTEIMTFTVTDDDINLSTKKVVLSMGLHPTFKNYISGLFRIEKVRHCNNKRR